jgi:5'-methylthioadenosine/S-adenosylhomocysteine nucleosidase
MTGILGAMREEVDAFVEVLQEERFEKGAATEFHRGRIDGHEVVVAKTGVGKVLSALSAAEMIGRYAPDRIIFTGIAGGIGEGLAIGDLVAGEDCLQYDFDVTALGFDIGAIPFSSYREIAGDPGLLTLMREYRPESYRLHFGRILTGDTFVTDKHSPERSELFRSLSGIAVEMEGASVALTGQVYNTPVLVLRFISDDADGSAPKNFQQFLEGCSHRSLEVIRYLLRRIAA